MFMNQVTATEAIHKSRLGRPFINLCWLKSWPGRLSNEPCLPQVMAKEAVYELSMLCHMQWGCLYQLCHCHDCHLCSWSAMATWSTNSTMVVYCSTELVISSASSTLLVSITSCHLSSHGFIHCSTIQPHHCSSDQAGHYSWSKPTIAPWSRPATAPQFRDLHQRYL